MNYYPVLTWVCTYHLVYGLAESKFVEHYNATICCIKQPSGAKKQQPKTGPQMKNELLAQTKFGLGFYFNQLNKILHQKVVMAGLVLHIISANNRTNRVAYFGDEV